MALPPGFLDELRARVPLSRVIGRKVSWDARKSNTGKGDYWAPCPFHQEKSASFHVDDRKGFYYCFGCHAKGDALTFLRETQNLSFMEAVESLAQEAGLPMPDRDPVRDRARAEAQSRRDQLIAVCEAAAKFWRGQLSGAAAGAARDYLEHRGLSAETRTRFGLGFAANARALLWQHLTGAGFAPDLIIEAGLCAKPDDGRSPYDRFRDRIIFPIRDARGRTIAFGGRAMSAEAQAKYLNSPETPLFDKGRNLYNLGPAREALAKAGPLIVAEGYMDVIALDQAGFRTAVAPLGTAITEEQLRMLWRLHPEPVIALDGDTAGLRAGHRLADLALGLIEAGQSLRFALLPAGQDPDDLLRSGGPAAMQAMIDTALPMARLIWDRETQGQSFDGPERRAALDKRLKALAAQIRDPDLRGEYLQEFRSLKDQTLTPPRRPWAPQGGGRPGFGPRRAAPQTALPITRASRLAQADPSSADELREARLLVALATHAAQIAQFEDALWTLTPANPDTTALHGALLDAAARGLAPGMAELDQASGGALSRLAARPDIAILPLLRPDAEPAHVSACLSEDFARLAADRAARIETEEALADLQDLPNENSTWRLRQAATARDRARSGSLGADIGGNGDESALSAQLDAMLKGEIWRKPHKRKK